ncbi:hypothetical protein [Dactylosporangium sp. CA-092794]|uniref:hypothetical protein n=1 Tax=Dactylosporangium sp. CA-092794 TaxID=3239929 RepID=UPI003D8E3F68
MSTDEAAVNFSGVASHTTEPLHADGAADFGAIDADADEELTEDAEDAPFDLDTDVAHPTLPHNPGPAFDVTRDVSL